MTLRTVCYLDSRKQTTNQYHTSNIRAKIKGIPTYLYMYIIYVLTYIIYYKHYMNKNKIFYVQNVTNTRYISEGRVFDYRWHHWNFSKT
jgi:hypothetical protein